jgi:hypothetical protein
MLGRWLETEACHGVTEGVGLVQPRKEGWITCLLLQFTVVAKLSIRVESVVNVNAVR